MFGGQVHLRAYAGMQRFGIGGLLGRIGMEQWTSQFAPISIELAAVATRTQKSATSAQAQFEAWTGRRPPAYFGDKPWENMLGEINGLDVVAVATPDPMHTQVILAALNQGAHVITEKPMCLSIHEADQIVRLARDKGLLVAVDMHKRYDPDHLRIRQEICRQIGEPLYGVAYLEEPLEVSTTTFKWAAQSDPFSYVGSHWVDLIWHYFHSKPLSLSAVGQKKCLASQGIDAYDAVQVRVDYENGLSMHFLNNWITPADFEGPVNQGHEIVGTRGKVESDQQYRGLRFWSQGAGSRTVNTHFTREVERADGSRGLVGYGVDSLAAAIAAICRRKFLEHSLESLAASYPTAEDGRVVVAIVHAARTVCDLNFRHMRDAKGAPVTARFATDGIWIHDPLQQGPSGCYKIYDSPV
jgi:predicted dehydrogenase